LGVCHDPDPIPFVRRTDRPRTHHDRPAGVTFRFQTSEHCIRPSASQSRNIFCEHTSGSHFRNDPEHFKPQAALFSAKSRTFSGGGNIGAWKSPADDINGQTAASSKSINCDIAHVLE